MITRTPTVTFTPSDGGLTPVTVALGSAPATVTSEGGWLIVNRPKNVGFTAWEGYAPRTMRIGLMFDGLAEGVSQEPPYDQLHNIMRAPVGISKQPSPVRVTGPLPLSGLKWVIQSIDTDSTTVLRGERGELLRAVAEITLLEYVEADVLVDKTVLSPAVRLEQKVVHSALGALAGGGGGGGTSGGGGRTYTVKVGDTLWGIAQKQLGAGKRYTEIASLNGIRNPSSVPVGTVLKLP